MRVQSGGCGKKGHPEISVGVDSTTPACLQICPFQTASAWGRGAEASLSIWSPGCLILHCQFRARPGEAGSSSPLATFHSPAVPEPPPAHRLFLLATGKAVTQEGSDSPDSHHSTV